MLTPYSTTLERSGTHDPHKTLPKMANLFINELLIRKPENFHEVPPWLAKLERPTTLRIPLETPDTEAEQTDTYTARIVPQTSTRPSQQTSPIWPHVKQRTGVRTLVRGISHHFNNLLMGIWGNLSLARLLTEHNSPTEALLDEMESLIEDGAYLTHLILGYLGERRIFAQRIRLKQLTQEVQTLLKKENPLVDMMGRLEWTDLPGKPALVTSCTGLIFEQFLGGIQTICQKIPYDSKTDSQFKVRLQNIDQLVQRGLTITHRMRCSTGNIAFRKRWINLSYLAQECADWACEKFPSVKIVCGINPNLPLLLADRRYLKIAIKEIVKNACCAMTGNDARLELNVNFLHDEPTAERCGINTIGDCAILTVRDNGKGIPEAEWKNIFKPFFTYPPHTTQVGLGLSATHGIIRYHGGHIQVYSKEGSGSTFKICLSIEKR
jgi:signal transduction histidine kinase